MLALLVALALTALAAVEPPVSLTASDGTGLSLVGYDVDESLRFVLWWETDENDVDFHIHDGKQNHAFYSQRQLASGGRLYADVTTGFGSECFTIEGPPEAFAYTREPHYYSRGPMGFGMGSMRVVQHDGNGTILVQDRPFVIMVDGASVDLGKVTKLLSD